MSMSSSADPFHFVKECVARAFPRRRAPRALWWSSRWRSSRARSQCNRARVLLLGAGGCSDISRRVDEARVKFESWQYALNNTNTAKNSSFKQDTAGAHAPS